MGFHVFVVWNFSYFSVNLILFPHGANQKLKQNLTKPDWPLKCRQRQAFIWLSTYQSFIIFSLTNGGHNLQAMVFIWLVRVFEIPAGSRRESAACRDRLSLIYTVPIGTCDCGRLSSFFSVWASPWRPCKDGITISMASLTFFRSETLNEKEKLHSDMISCILYKVPKCLKAVFLQLL